MIVSLFPAGSVAPDPAARVLKAGEYAALAEAENIIAEARAAAAAMMEQSVAAVEESRRKGYEEGLREGNDEAAEKLFEMVTASVDQLATMEEALVDVVMKSIRTILGSFAGEELTIKTVSHALRLVRDEKRVTLRVAADAAETVRERLAGIVANYPGMGRIDVVADASLDLGGCVMETEIGVIDATLDRQLKIIEDTFRRHLEERNGQ